LARRAETLGRATKTEVALLAGAVIFLIVFFLALSPNLAVSILAAACKKLDSEHQQK